MIHHLAFFLLQADPALSHLWVSAPLLAQWEYPVPLAPCHQAYLGTPIAVATSSGKPLRTGMDNLIISEPEPNHLLYTQKEATGRLYFEKLVTISFRDTCL
jgi:hypothetical protein